MAAQETTEASPMAVEVGALSVQGEEMMATPMDAQKTVGAAPTAAEAAESLIKPVKKESPAWQP
jgi:hypothetical protein